MIACSHAVKLLPIFSIIHGSATPANLCALHEQCALACKLLKAIVESIRCGTYLPKPVLGVEIPKGGGKKRRIGVPVVMDRMLQQALGQVLCSRYDMEFEEYNYGFRPNRNAHQTVLRAEGYINSGNHWIEERHTSPRRVPHTGI
jgi:hypothetical protein